MKRKMFQFLIAAAICLLPLSAVKAANTQAGSSVYVAPSDIVSGNLYAAGQNVTIDGTISGDLIAAAQTITVNGQVEGDIIAVAQDITVNGNVGGNIRVAGNAVTINGTTARNINAFGNNIVLGGASHTGWDVYLAGMTTEIRGVIDGGLSGSVGQALIAGKIGKDVNLRLSKASPGSALTISPEAVIGGDINYTAKNTADISDQAKVSGKIQETTIQTSTINWFLLWLWSRIFAIFAAMVVGLVLVFISQKITIKILAKMTERPLKMLVPGLVIMFITPPIALILALTLIGLPLALIIGAGWVIASYLAKILTAILIGQVLINRIFPKKEASLFWSLIIGVIICWILFAIPLVGWILSLIAVWFGLGGLWTYASHQLRNI